jgi:hypothetical protein
LKDWQHQTSLPPNFNYSFIFKTYTKIEKCQTWNWNLKK